MRKVPEAQQVSAPTDPIEGYYAQQKAPTARELLSHAHNNPLSAPLWETELAARVEAVLALQPKGWTGDTSRGWDMCLAEVLRLLNGEQP